MLDGPHAQGAFLLKAVFADTWSIAVEDEAPLTLIVMARGSAALLAVGATHRLGAGDVAVVKGPAPYLMANHPTTPPEVRILPGQVCVDPHGRILDSSMDLGVRSWGNTREDERATVMLIGTYPRATSVGARVLAQLPGVSVLRDLDTPLVGLLATEVARDAPGQTAVLDRLLDLLLVTVLRRALADLARPGWLSGYDDPTIGPILRLMQEHPDRPWTVAMLAERAGLSRAAFARRFSDRVGLAPLTFLTGWRLAMAADLLAGSDLTLAAIASKVGYSSAFALSAAFKREHGVSPSAYRAAA